MSKKTIYIIIGIVILAAVGFFIYRRMKKKQEQDQTNALVNQQLQQHSGGNSSGTNTAVATPPAANAFPLQKGSKGADVLRLQRALNRIQPANPIAEDQYFGNATATKLILSVATTMYTVGPQVTEDQLTKIIALGNQS